MLLTLFHADFVVYTRFIRLGSDRLRTLGPKRTTLPCFLCSFKCVSPLWPQQTSHSRQKLVIPARIGPGNSFRGDLKADQRNREIMRYTAPQTKLPLRPLAMFVIVHVILRLQTFLILTLSQTEKNTGCSSLVAGSYIACTVLMHTAVPCKFESNPAVYWRRDRFCICYSKC